MSQAEQAQLTKDLAADYQKQALAKLVKEAKGE